VILLTVADTGIGIPKGDESKVFSKFFRSENAVLKETEGSGLGLSVVKSYLEESGAKISFESEENVGTTFSVEFPLDSAEKRV
jgi:signal transduction histidine kinase